MPTQLLKKSSITKIDVAKTNNTAGTNKKGSKRIEPEVECDVDPDLQSELEALVRQCAAANPEADENENENNDRNDDVTAASGKKGKRKPLRAPVAVALTAAVEESVRKSSTSISEHESGHKRVEISSGSSINDRNSGDKEKVKNMKSGLNGSSSSSSSGSGGGSSSGRSNSSSGSNSNSNSSGSSKGWNFEVDYNDHFETPLVAYTDILPMLHTLAVSLGKTPAELIIYDPYYCQGGMVQMLKDIGFPKVQGPHFYFSCLIFLSIDSSINQFVSP